MLDGSFVSRWKIAHRALVGALIGASVGVLFGLWTLASHGSNRFVRISGLEPPAPPECPEGYARVSGFDPSATLQGTRVRWLARCDPRLSRAAWSEAMELFWIDEVYFDVRARTEALENFVRAFARSGNIVLEPSRHARQRQTPVDTVPAVAIETQGTYSLPSLVMQVWIFPVGSETLQVTMVAPRNRELTARAAVVDSLQRIEGLRPFDPSVPSSRRWTVRVRCPDGYTDATPPDGGPAQTAYVGRYCLSPGQDGGVEITFAQLAARADDDRSVQRLLDMARITASAVGVSTGAGFGPVETVRVGSIEGKTARMHLDPPRARVTLHAWMLPSGQSTLYAMSTSMPEHADTARATLERWIRTTGLVRPYDAQAIANRRRRVMLVGLLVPASFTAMLGAAIAIGWQRRRTQETHHGQERK